MTFKDSKLQQQLEDEGVVKVPFLNSKQVEDIQHFIKKKTTVLQLAEEQGFMSGVAINDKKEKFKIDEKVRELLDPICSTYLNDYEALVYTVLAKAPTEHSQLDIHQDWSLVDEEKHYSLSLWIPLIDTNIENGTVHVVRGSHKEFNNIRGGSIPSIFHGQLSENLMSRMEPIEVKAGEALLFNQRLVHYSPINQTSTTRISLISSIIPKESDAFLYYREKPDTTEVYKMSRTFFLEYDDFIREKDLRPNGERVKDIYHSYK